MLLLFFFVVKPCSIKCRLVVYVMILFVSKKMVIKRLSVSVSEAPAFY